jgi:hypothetical protein
MFDIFAFPLKRGGKANHHQKIKKEKKKRTKIKKTKNY